MRKIKKITWTKYFLIKKLHLVSNLYISYIYKNCSNYFYKNYKKGGTFVSQLI